MHEILTVAAIFVCLLAASLGSLFLSERLPARYRQDDTHDVVRLAANIFVVTTSLVLGLLLNSAKNTFEMVDKNVHFFATDLIILDRTLRHYGPEASDVRRLLTVYVRQIADERWGVATASVPEDLVAERLLDQVGDALAAIRPSDPARFELWRDAQVSLQQVVRRHWSLIEESEGTIPMPFIIMVTAWLMLIFGSYGYRAPRNAVAAMTLVVAGFLISVAIYLVLDMDSPFSGTIQLSPAPLERALEQGLR